MKTGLLTLVLATLALTQASAQDDMYFVPAKKVKAQQSEVPYAGKTYYSGISKSNDEYNRRRGKKGAMAQLPDSLALDSVASDVITFAPKSKHAFGIVENGDTTYINVTDIDDYLYCRTLQRFDDFFWEYRFRGPYWRYGWWGFYDPWHHPWYDPWFDPWFDPWYGPWYNSWWMPPSYSSWYSYYGPWYPHRRWQSDYGYFYGGGGGGSSYHTYKPGRGGVVVRSSVGSNGNNAIARRNGDRISRTSSVHGGGSNIHARGGENGGYTRYSPDRSGGTTYYSGGGSYSGGGTGGGGGFSGGGGYSGGGGSRGGGGGHVGGRR